MKLMSMIIAELNEKISMELQDVFLSSRIYI